MQIDACDELHALGLQVSAGSFQKSYIPGKTRGFKLSSWVFDGRKEKDCLLAPMKVAGKLTVWRLLLVDLQDIEVRAKTLQRTVGRL